MSVCVLTMPCVRSVSETEAGTFCVRSVSGQGVGGGSGGRGGDDCRTDSGRGNARTKEPLPGWPVVGGMARLLALGAPGLQKSFSVVVFYRSAAGYLTVPAMVRPGHRECFT